MKICVNFPDLSPLAHICKLQRLVTYVKTFSIAGKMYRPDRYRLSDEKMMLICTC